VSEQAGGPPGTKKRVVLAAAGGFLFLAGTWQCIAGLGAPSSEYSLTIAVLGGVMMFFGAGALLAPFPFRDRLASFDDRKDPILRRLRIVYLGILLYLVAGFGAVAVRVCMWYLRKPGLP
jgi:hypothetical protein